jgi:hypothetical protein
VNRRRTAQHPLASRQQALNRRRSQIRARGEHVFHVVKRLWGFTKVRYRDLRKNAARAFTLFGLANLRGGSCHRGPSPASAEPAARTPAGRPGLQAEPSEADHPFRTVIPVAPLPTPSRAVTSAELP